jgi:hypothetical protein
MLTVAMGGCLMVVMLWGISILLILALKMRVFMAQKTKKIKAVVQKVRDAALKRQHKVTVLLNDKELEAIEVYCKKYKVKSKAGFMREATLRTVMTQFLEDYPTLFHKQELDSLVVRHVAEP